MNSEKKTLQKITKKDCRIFDFVIYKPLNINIYNVFNRTHYSKFRSMRKNEFTVNSFSWNKPGFYSLPLYSFRKMRRKTITEVSENCE